MALSYWYNSETYCYPKTPISHHEGTLIRPFRLRDSLSFQRLVRRSAPLQLERHLTQPYSPLWAAVGAPVPWHGSGAATYLYLPDTSNPPISGFIQAIKRFGHPEADVTRIAPLPDHNTDRSSEIWQSLLTYIANAAGEHGIQRLFICITSEDPHYGSVCNSGFVPYIRETLFRLPGVPEPGSQQIDETHVRPQREIDSFALMRIASRYSPAVVQQAEGIFTNNGDPPAPLVLRTWWQPEHIEGFVFEEDGEVIAAAHIQRGHNGHWLRLYGDPDSPEIIRQLLVRALYALSHYRNRPVYCALRPYQSSFGPLLRDAHFVPGPEITRFVKHTTVFAKRPALNLASEAAKGSLQVLSRVKQS